MFRGFALLKYPSFYTLTVPAINHSVTSIAASILAARIQISPSSSLEPPLPASEGQENAWGAFEGY
jgi:hypothetical protein